MESGEKDDAFPSIESIAAQSKIDSLYQSRPEKGVRKLCHELLDLKDAVDNLCGNMRTKYLAFLSLNGVAEENPQVCEEHGSKPCELCNDRMLLLDNIDALLAEYKVEEAVEALVAEERKTPELRGSADSLSEEANSYRLAFLKRKATVEDQLAVLADQPLVNIGESRKALSCFIKLGKGPSAHQLLLKSFGSHLQKRIDVFLPSSSSCPRFSATLAKLVFSSISATAKESVLVFGDNPIYTNRVVQFAEWEIEYFVHMVKENAPASETVSALHAACVCIQASLSYCSLLESHGLKLSRVLLVLLRPYFEEVLELNFRRARKAVLNLLESEESLPVSPGFVCPLSAFATSFDDALTDNGLQFMYIINEILGQLTSLALVHFGANILNRISQLFDQYVDALSKALPGNDNLPEIEELLPFRAETDPQQLELLGMAYAIADELLPDAIWNVWNPQSESKELRAGALENASCSTPLTVEVKEWRRHLQHSFDKLRDHFCRRYVLSFIYSRDGNTRLHAQIYLSGNGEDQCWDSDPLPSLPFQALFAKLQQLATVPGDVLLENEKMQKTLLARLIETVVMWLSEEHEFWSAFEDDSSTIQPLGLQRLILDMHFTVEIARFAGYPSRHVHHIASAIIARAVRTFSARGIGPQSTLPEDKWFVETAKFSVNKLLETSGLDTSEIDGDRIIHDGIFSDTDQTASSLSTVESI